MKRWMGWMMMAAAVVSIEAYAENTRVTNPGALSVEGLGRGLSYSVNFDRVVSDELAGGVGIGSVSAEYSVLGEEFGTTRTVIPVYLNYYLTRDAGSLYFTGGVSIITGDEPVLGEKTKVGGITLPESGILPTFGVGYENRGDFGFLLRVTAYGMVGEKFAPWGGFSLGYAF